jgi:hypothetical protein
VRDARAALNRAIERADESRRAGPMARTNLALAMVGVRDCEVELQRREDLLAEATEAIGPNQS